MATFTDLASHMHLLLPLQVAGRVPICREAPQTAAKLPGSWKFSRQNTGCGVAIERSGGGFGKCPALLPHGHQPTSGSSAMGFPAGWAHMAGRF